MLVLWIPVALLSEESIDIDEYKISISPVLNIPLTSVPQKYHSLSSSSKYSQEPEIFIDKEKIDERLRQCEKALSEFEKLVLSHYLAGEKQSEIAENLNKDVKSIDNTLQRIKSKLK